jgi:hypothetical protein
MTVEKNAIGKCSSRCWSAGNAGVAAFIFIKNLGGAGFENQMKFVAAANRL